VKGGDNLMVGLSKAEIKDEVIKAGITDEKIINAITEVIIKNNKKLEKQLPDVTYKSINDGLKQMGI
jgi:hypothetical protein